MNKFAVLKIVGAFLLFIALLVVVNIVIPQIGVTDSSTTELEIVQVTNTVGPLGIDYTIFVVKTDDGEYTLPSVRAERVRAYHEQDMLPIKIETFVGGKQYMYVNTEAL